MLTATVPLEGGALPDLLGGAGLAYLLDTAPTQDIQQFFTRYAGTYQ